MKHKLKRAWNGAVTEVQILLARKVSDNECVRLIDVGASSLSQPRIARAFAKSELIAFDPDPRSEDNFDNLGFKVHFYPYAIAGKNGRRTLYLTRKSHCSSLLQPLKTDDPRYHVEREVIVECRTLDSLEIRADAIKIDVQGAELEILRQAESTLSEAHVVQLEICFERLYAGQTELSDLYEYMRSQGFICAGFGTLYFGDSTLGSGISFGDIFFVRLPKTDHDRKIVLVALVDAALDSLVGRYVANDMTRRIDRIIVRTVRLLGSLKFAAPIVN